MAWSRKPYMVMVDARAFQSFRSPERLRELTAVDTVAEQVAYVRETPHPRHIALHTTRSYPCALAHISLIRHQRERQQ